MELAGWIVMPYPGGAEVYCIRAELFERTYRLDDRKHHTPTQEECLAEWAPVLKSKTENLYRESDVVFAKHAVLGDDNVEDVAINERTASLADDEYDKEDDLLEGDADVLMVRVNISGASTAADDAAMAAADTDTTQPPKTTVSL